MIINWRHLKLSIFRCYLAIEMSFCFTEQENYNDIEGSDSDSGTTVCVDRGLVAATKRQSDKQISFCEKDFGGKLKVSYSRGPYI